MIPANVKLWGAVGSFNSCVEDLHFASEHTSILGVVWRLIGAAFWAYATFKFWTYHPGEHS